MNGEQIQNITADGFTYLDEDGNKKFIDFSLCYENYLKETTSPEYIARMKELNPQSQWDDDGVKKYIERRTKWRGIGERNVLAKPWADGPYIEFYTQPRIRFDFATEDEYRKVRYAIEQFGWRTFDRS